MRIERRLACMGTLLTLEVEATSRREALLASEAAVRALEETEARLSTWRSDSELARLNRAPVGEAFELSPELQIDLEFARAGWERTDGAFDPALGTLVEAFGLRRGGNLPDAATLEAARVPGGFAALALEGGWARRSHPNLVLEEGGFGKGRGLDLALACAARSGARRLQLDLGGQIALLASEQPYTVAVRHPNQPDRIVLELGPRSGSLATSGNGERGLLVAGRPVGHIIDPRSAQPAPDFGSLTVWAQDATWADMLSTGLFVLGPEEALARAARSAEFGVLVLEPCPQGGPSLRARCDATFAALVTRRFGELELELVGPAPVELDPSPVQDPLR